VTSSAPPGNELPMSRIKRNESRCPISTRPRNTFERVLRARRGFIRVLGGIGSSCQIVQFVADMSLPRIARILVWNTKSRDRIRMNTEEDREESSHGFSPLRSYYVPWLRQPRPFNPHGDSIQKRSTVYWTVVPSI